MGGIARTTYNGQTGGRAPQKEKENETSCLLIGQSSALSIGLPFGPFDWLALGSFYSWLIPSALFDWLALSSYIGLTKKGRRPAREETQHLKAALSTAYALGYPGTKT